MSWMMRFLRQLRPSALIRRAALFLAAPDRGEIDFGDLGRLTPISDDWGFDRGTPVDRHYIEEFLGAHASDVRGDVLEIGDDTYTRRFGGSRVRKVDVLHAEGGRGVTMVGDLTRANEFERDRFDCVILTQTLQFVADPSAAVETVGRILRPGGVCLATFSGITKVSRDDMDRWGQYFSLTSRAARELFGRHFSPDGVAVDAVGNVLTATAFLYGIAAEELPGEALVRHDPDFELLVRVRAEKTR